MPQITISLSEDVFTRLKTRAKKNLLSTSEQIQDIVRRSMLSYKKTSSTPQKIDDSLVNIFSRQKKGKKRK